MTLDMHRLEALDSAGTKAPWHVRYGIGKWRAREGRCHGISVKTDAEAEAWAHSNDDELWPTDIIETDSGCYGPSSDDAELLVAARNAVPQVVAIVRAGDHLADVVRLLDSGNDMLVDALASYDTARKP